jgi:release factor glutamine methyltransferase
LLARALGLSQEALLRDRDAVIDAAVFDAFVAHRAAREPLALILGQWEFWSLPFTVSAHTLIPRPETETLIEAALLLFPRRACVERVLDLGTGAGPLLLAALSEFSMAYGIGVDVSPAAAALAAANARALGLADRAACLAGNWAHAINGRFNLVLCNPPYIPTAAIAALMPEVARFEPRSALDGGADGLAAYRRIFGDLARLVATNGAAVFEVGAGQAPLVSALAERAGFAVATRADLAGVERAVILRPVSSEGDAR